MRGLQYVHRVPSESLSRDAAMTSELLNIWQQATGSESRADSNGGGCWPVKCQPQQQCRTVPAPLKQGGRPARFGHSAAYVAGTAESSRTQFIVKTTTERQGNG